MLGELAQQQGPGNEEGAGGAAERRLWSSRGRYQGLDASCGKNGKILNSDFKQEGKRDGIWR